MAQWEFVEWLLFWILETSHFEFEWDSGNRTKNAVKHRISTEEVEAVFRSGAALPLGIQISPPANEQRLGLVGPTLGGRLLHVAFVLREGRVRVISARPAHKKERKQYEEILRKISERV
ncbi:MAG: BrnT family toxin [Bdellovibrionales bacterium]|nr:BrnT family toxin [Bdellovibrionales bacterium]